MHPQLGFKKWKGVSRDDIEGNLKIGTKEEEFTEEEEKN
jgi:hypothetical protein